MGNTSGVLYTRAAKIALPVGILVYATGLWPICTTLSEKGYYIALLALGLFSAVVYVHLRRHHCFSALMKMWCQLMLLISMGLLAVGLWNEPITLSQRIIYFVAWVISLIAMTVCLKARYIADPEQR
ncbi:YiaA/YiaB family inner membrane protein [Superficieibacter sp. HKU1]|uniref:YiaA/YiaB family inner membrane protein n=1 Tax=Superficieibacter sp. HKU1 TaxID=3031919 RepID=UPI0023E0A870|nr:YiaA/YiaB family inner membrane protein [Superficieibacter sp. HKU1]WES68652.1 YiaA/YiaB family inner membrane protein [Superficieibacter sp. HKU1]